MGLRNLLAAVALGSSVLAGQILATPVQTGADAWTVASSSSSVSGVDLFDFEQIQLDEDLDSTTAKTFGIDTTGKLGKRYTSGQCKPLPGDPGWPKKAEWDALNKLLGGALIPTIPAAASCYHDWGLYDEAKCAAVTSSWSSPLFHEADPTSIMWPLYQGRSCLPPSLWGGDGANRNCTLGGYPSYAVNATNVAQVQVAVNFARTKGLRLVIKNTGHDYVGKGSGAGALSIWTHNLRGYKFVPDLQIGDYSGPALKVAAGMVSTDVYQAAEDNNVVVLGGMCLSVGWAGGYLAGGGHSPMSTIYGLAADQILALEVVTASGRFLTVTEASQPDLFWALRGGGGGTFGVVTSVIVRAHPQTTFVAAKIHFQWDAMAANTAEPFWDGVRAFFEDLPNIHSHGLYSFLSIVAGVDSGIYSFDLLPLFAPNHTLTTFNAIINPFLAALTALNVTYTSDIRQYPTYFSAYRASFPTDEQLVVATPINLMGSRLFPSSLWSSAARFDATFAAIRRVAETTGNVNGFHFAPRNPLRQDNAVSPALRDAYAFLQSWTAPGDGSSPETLARTQQFVQREVLDVWRAAAPASDGGGTYLNEANPEEREWQTDFYGGEAVYGRLVAIKALWDPYGLFYATTGVGSEGWEVDTVRTQGVQTQDGPLCRV